MDKEENISEFTERMKGMYEILLDLGKRYIEVIRGKANI
jgi:hypothetical protein